MYGGAETNDTCGGQLSAAPQPSHQSGVLPPLDPASLLHTNQHLLTAGWEVSTQARHQCTGMTNKYVIYSCCLTFQKPCALAHFISLNHDDGYDHRNRIGSLWKLGWAIRNGVKGKFSVNYSAKVSHNCQFIALYDWIVVSGLLWPEKSCA